MDDQLQGGQIGFTSSPPPPPPRLAFHRPPPSLTSMACCSALVTLMVHLTTSSYHIASYFGADSRRVKRGCGASSSGMSAPNTYLRYMDAVHDSTLRVSGRGVATRVSAPTKHLPAVHGGEQWDGRKHTCDTRRYNVQYEQQYTQLSVHNVRSAAVLKRLHHEQVERAEQCDALGCGDNAVVDEAAEHRGGGLAERLLAHQLQTSTRRGVRWGGKPHSSSAQ